MKVKSTLPNGDFYIHLAVMLDVVVLVCVLIFLYSDIVPRFGFSVKTPSSEFLMDSLPAERYLVAVTAGTDPVVFLDSKRLDGGIAQLKDELDGIVEKYRAEGTDLSRVGVILVLDRAVSRATEQKLVDMVLSRNMICSIASDPSE